MLRTTKQIVAVIMVFSFTTTACIENDNNTEQIDEGFDLEGKGDGWGSEVPKMTPLCATVGRCSPYDTWSRLFRGHDSGVVFDESSGKVVRDSTYCMLKDGSGTSAPFLWGSDWYEFGMDARFDIFEARPPTLSSKGFIAGAHYVDLVIFGKRISLDGQNLWGEFPIEWGNRQSRQNGWRLTPQRSIVPNWISWYPIAYYADLHNSNFSGRIDQNISGADVTITQNASRSLIGGNTISPYASLNDGWFPFREIGNESFTYGVKPNSSGSSNGVSVVLPIFGGNWIDFDLIVEFKNRHSVQMINKVEPEAPDQPIGTMELVMNNSLTLLVKARVKVKLPWPIGDHVHTETFINKTSQRTTNLGYVKFQGRKILAHRGPDGRYSANPQQWLNSCLATPAPSRRPPRPPSLVDFFAKVRRTVVNNVNDCSTLIHGEWPNGQLCDNAGNRLNTVGN